MSKKRKPGRPKGQPLSPKELAQRRAAALKHGEFAESALGQALPPCKPAVCPVEGEGRDGYPCEIKRTIEEGGGGLSNCLLALGEQETIDKYVRAIVSGDVRGIAQLAATSLAAKNLLHERGLKKLIDDGLVVDEPILGRDPENGTVKIIGYRAKEHPAAPFVLRLGEHLGHTASDQVVTPKARGDKARNDAVEKLGHLAWMAMMRKSLGSAGDEGDDA